MKEVVIITMKRNTELSTEIEFLSNQLISFTRQLHTLRSWMKGYKRPRINAMMQAYNDIKKDIRLIRQALTGKFNIIVVRDLSGGDEEKMNNREFEFKEFERSSGETDVLALLNKDYDLSVDSDLELAMTLKTLCNEYIMCCYALSSATCEVWGCIVRVAKEIVRREGERE